MMEKEITKKKNITEKASYKKATLRLRKTNKRNKIIISDMKSILIYA